MNTFESFSFLEQLPLEIRNRLDTAAWFVPQHALASTCTRLEAELHAHIMVYRAEAEKLPSSDKIDLCALLLPAQLDEKALASLRKVEDDWKHLGIRFVAYSKPLQMRETSMQHCSLRG